MLSRNPFFQSCYHATRKTLPGVSSLSHAGSLGCFSEAKLVN